MKRCLCVLMAVIMLIGILPVMTAYATDETNFTPFKLTITRTGAPQEGYKRLLVKNEFGFEPAGDQLLGCVLNGTVTYTGSEDFSKSVQLKDVEVISQPARSDGNIALDFKTPDGYTICTTDAEDKNYKWDITISPAVKGGGSESKPTDTGMKEGFTYIVLAPGNYTDNGSWKLDNDDSGITYMIAGKDGNPRLSSPATIKVVLPKEGSYKIYAFSKDYTTDPGTRYYDVQLGTHKFTTGNHGKNGFHWQETETFVSFAGEYDFKVIDSRANHARSAMIVITDDLEFKPGSSVAAIKALTAKQYKVGDLKVSDTLSLEGRPDTEIAVLLNGNWMEFDVPPVLMNNRTMVPFRAIFEALGCTVSWDGTTRTASGTRNGMKVELPIGNNNARVDGKNVTLDQSAVILNDRTLVPLRFVSEALGAQVKWDSESKTVVILAEVPASAVLFTQASFTDVGTWIKERNADGAFNGEAMRGLNPEGQGATLADADISGAKPAYVEFELAKSGTYKIWVRSRDFAANQQGDRFFQLSFNNDALMPHKYGTHGGTGYAWACGGTVELNAGENVLYVHDTSGFYARFDAIFITEDEDYIPSENYNTMLKIAKPYTNGIHTTPQFPAYATEQAQPTESTVIENEFTKVVFYKVPTTGGQVVQREIYSKVDGAWIKTTNRNENLGYLAVRADEASYTEDSELLTTHATFNYNGKNISSSTVNPYASGIGEWFIPTDYIVEGNQVILTGANGFGTMKATWSLDDNTAPLVSIDVTFAKDGYYTIGAHEGKGFSFEQFEYALAPFRVAYKRVTDEPRLYTESYLFTPMGTHTLYPNNEYSALPVTKGVVVEPSWIPVRWVYSDNNLFGITMNDMNGMHQGAVFAPVLGSAESKMVAGQTYNLQVRMISTVKEWFANYEDTVTNLFDVTDYRKNYVVSLNQAIFNTRKTMMDDKYSGWDVYDKAHYNMETGNRTSPANSMEALQVYLLTEDEEVLTRRTIPTIANALTRGYIHFNRVGTSDEDYFQSVSDPSPIGAPISGFNANVWGGMYEMTRGSVPSLHSQALVKGTQKVTNSYGSIAPFVNDLNMYKYTGDKTYLDKAVAAADKYLEDVVYAENTQMPEWSSFIWISYYPNLGSLMDIYEVTGDKKYLDAAEETAKWMSTAFWVPGVDGTRKTDKIIKVNDWEAMQKNLWLAKDEGGRTYWWAGDKQLRIGREENLAENPESLKNITDRTRMEEGWVASRTGLGIEQASTFKNGLNIIMQSFVGDYLKLAAYTGNDFYVTMARNTIIGRFSNYDGYYRAAYTTYQQEIDYPREGPDYTNLYWHHIPPFLAMLEDFLINQTFAWSNQNISFPSLRQNGYAYFNSNQYGHAPGKFYDENDMWLWLDEGIVNPDSIQIDWLATKKDGVLGIAFMNEDEVTTTATVTLGDKVPGGKTFNGTATLYDENGQIGSVDIVNGVFTLTIPAKSLQAVKFNIDGITKPKYASMNYSATSAELGATVTEHKNGKGYTLQMSPDFYYAYVYTTSTQRKIKSATLTYTVNGETKTETATIYPFEFIVKVDDPNAEFTYTLSETALDGKVTELGGGTLMTLALSQAKGIKAPVSQLPKDDDKETAKPAVNATAEAKALKFDAFDVKYSMQGNDLVNYRFVMQLSDLPFEPNAENVVGLPVRGKLKDNGNEIEVNSFIVGYEARGNDGCVLIVAPVENIPLSKYGSSGGADYSWNIKIYPYGK